VHELLCYFTTYLLNINAFLSLENKVSLGLRFLVAISFYRRFSSDISTRQFQILNDTITMTIRTTKVLFLFRNFICCQFEKVLTVYIKIK
jgi:hypothetical protein